MLGRDTVLKTTAKAPDARPLAFYIHSVASGLGAENVLLSIVSGLAAQGRKVDLLIENPDRDLREKLHPGIGLVDLGKGGPLPGIDVLFRLVSLLVNLAGGAKTDPCGQVPFRTALTRFLFKRRPPLYALNRYLRAKRPRSIISFLNYPNLALLLAAQLGKRDTRIYVNVRNHISGSVKGAKSRRMTEIPVLMRNLFPLADGVVAVSEGVASDTMQLTDTPPNRVTTILNPLRSRESSEPVNAEALHPWLQADGPPLVLSIGKMRPQKDFPTLLKAFARLRRERPARLIVLGDGDGRKSLEALAEQLGIRSDVDFPGYVKNPFAFYRHASVFVLSSAWEGLPNVLIEAVASGCPIVSTDCPSGPSEILDGGRLGRLVPIGDDEAMAKAIAETLDQTKERQATERQVQGGHVQRFALDRIVEAYDTLLTREAA